LCTFGYETSMLSAIAVFFPHSGSWFSFPTWGRCNTTAQPMGTNGCSWRLIQHKTTPTRQHNSPSVGIGTSSTVTGFKTISGNCLLQHGLVRMCGQGAPVHGGCNYGATAKVIEDGFASDDPSRGGCKTVPVPVDTTMFLS
jgi:hypothetical protein